MNLKFDLLVSKLGFKCNLYHYILGRARRRRLLLLTTHSMDEAELLSNRIGILAKVGGCTR